MSYRGRQGRIESSWTRGAASQVQMRCGVPVRIDRSSMA